MIVYGVQLYDVRKFYIKYDNQEMQQYLYQIIAEGLRQLQQLFFYHLYP